MIEDAERSEKLITEDIRKYLKELKKRVSVKLHWIKLAGQGRQRVGTPDFLIVYYGIPIFLEVKTASGQPTKRQIAEMWNWSKAGAAAHVVRSVADVKAVLGTQRKKNEIEPEKKDDGRAVD